MLSSSCFAPRSPIHTTPPPHRLCSICLFIYIGQTWTTPPCISTVQHQGLTLPILIPISWVPQSSTRTSSFHSSKVSIRPHPWESRILVPRPRAWTLWLCMHFIYLRKFVLAACLMQCHVLQCRVMQRTREVQYRPVYLPSVLLLPLWLNERDRSYSISHSPSPTRYETSIQKYLRAVAPHSIPFLSVFLGRMT
jgi:hypothetical protein